MKFIALAILSIFQLFTVGCRNNTGHPKATVARDSDSLQTSFALKISKEKSAVVDSFERFVSQTMDETHIPGSAVAIVKDNKILLLNSPPIDNSSAEL